jgi:acylphosphatase
MPTRTLRIKAVFRVTGRVQGVYFRHSTRIEAERLKLCGVARNLSDGSVEVIAHGAPDAIAELKRWLAHGPPLARVETVEDHSAEQGDGAATPPSSFTVA